RGAGDDADPRRAAMEEAVRPGVMETLDRIAAAYAKLRRIEEQRIELARRNRTLSAHSVVDGGVFGLFDGRDAALC
ncbi:MAG: hypothetical protein OXH14_09535, partial [Alphaproteobacteria bacterium]|nr:hypothetical protein [Alphaproteobacteria bacterium]